jgi:hypothetical protein
MSTDLLREKNHEFVCIKGVCLRGLRGVCTQANKLLLVGQAEKSVLRNKLLTPFGAFLCDLAIALDGSLKCLIGFATFGGGDVVGADTPKLLNCT